MPVPSSLAQSMVRSSIREPHAGVYVLVDACTCPEVLDPALLMQAWTQVSGRHRALRTSFSVSPNGQVEQAIEPSPEYVWRELDGPTLLESFLEAEREAGFDFASGVPMRFALLRTGAESTTIVWTVHHGLLDGRSLLTVWREWLDAYDDLAAGRTPSLPPAQPTSALSPSVAAPDLPDAHPIIDRLKAATPPPTTPYAGHQESLSAALTTRLDDFARANQVTLGTLILAAWAVVLQRFTGQSDVVFGVTRAGSRDAVGLFIDTIPFRVTLDADQPVLAWLRRIRQDTLALRPFEHTMAMHSVVVYDHEPPEASLHRLGGKWPGRSFVRRQRSATPLLLGAYGRPELSLHISYDTSLYCHATAAVIASCLRNILIEFEVRSSGPVSAIRLIDDNQAATITRPASRPFPSHLLAHDLLTTQVSRTPHHTALETADVSISFAELNTRANRLANHLRTLGAGPDDLVAICLPGVRDTIVAIFAVLKAGAAFLTLDPALPESRRQALLDHARPRLTLTALPDDTAYPDTDPPPLALPHHAAYAVFTSGSTGQPKAIVVPHSSLVNHTLAAAPVYGLGPTDRRLQFAALGSDVFVAEIFNCLTSGGTIVICPGVRQVSLREFHRLLEVHRITITASPGSWWNTWAAALSSGAMELPGSLRAIVVGMESADAAAFQRWRRAAGNRLRWFNAYGPAENCPTSTIYEAGSSSWECPSILPIGRPIANTAAYVLDSHRQLLPPGVAGELYLGGAGVSRGYLGAPELSAAAFLDDPFQPGGRMYRTGDLAFALPDGNLVFLGRTDRQVKIRGYRVELDEIEHALAQHPAVRQCAVVAAGDGNRRQLLAYAVGDLSADEIRLHLARLLPSYMVPAGCMTIERMPLTSTGKIDRLSLPPFQPSTAVSAPLTATELSLAALWRELLPATSPGALDSFFDLGGDSLAATQLLLRIEEQFGVELSLAALYQAPALARLAALIDAGPRPDALLALQPDGYKPPLVCITTTTTGPRCFRRLARALGAEQPFFVVPHLAPGGLQTNLIPELARITAETLRKELPEGGYVLGGYCFGGAVAYETAQLLAAGGAKVRLVVLFDTPAPGYPKLTGSSGNYLRHFRNMIREGFRIPSAAHLQEIGTHATAVGTLLHRKAVARYEPGTATFPVVQFLASEEPISTKILSDPRLGWRELCRGEFHLHYIGGTHESLFDEHPASQISAILSLLTAR